MGSVSQGPFACGLYPGFGGHCLFVGDGQEVHTDLVLRNAAAGAISPLEKVRRLTQWESELKTRNGWVRLTLETLSNTIILLSGRAE
jgi:hypothetical protein